VTLLGARHVPERLCGGYVYLGRYISVRPLPLPLQASRGVVDIKSCSLTNLLYQPVAFHKFPVCPARN